MAKKILPPYFVGTAQFLTFYKMHGEYFVRAKSSLTAERVKKDPRFAGTMKQARFMAEASRLGAKAYTAIPFFCKEFGHFRMLTGKANLLLKQGLKEQEVLDTLIDKYVRPLVRQAVKEGRRIARAKKKRMRRTPKPWYLAKHRRLRMVEWSIGDGKESIYPMEAVNNMLETVLNAPRSPAFIVRPVFNDSMGGKDNPMVNCRIG